MPRHRQVLTNPDESDTSPSDEDDLIFDINELESDPESEATSVEDLGNDGNHDPEIDLEDQIQLFGGNIHPPEYYRQAVKEFNESAFDSEDYCTGTNLLLDAVEEQWCLYCGIIQRDPQECFKLLSISRDSLKSVSVPEAEHFKSLISLLYNFFDWRLNQRLNKDGRKLRGTKKKSSLSTLWKVFRLVCERAIGDKLNPKLNRSIHKVLRALAKKHKLSDQRRANRCMTINNLEQQIETTLSTTKKSFKLGELRILAVLFLLLLAPAGARPTSILRLRFGDILTVLVRDPEGGPHNILIKFTLAFTKTYLGEKDAKTYPLPETLFAESLLLSPHIFLLGILFRHKAFRARNLTSSHQLKTLDIHPGELEMQLPLREDLKDVYIFRRAVQTVTGLDISDNKPISYAMMAAWIRRIGEILGLEIPTIPYNLRYNAANEWTSNVDVSEALRNLAMDHANSVPLQRHYLGRDIDKDLFSILKGTKSQHALVKQSCSVGHSISKRRPIDLTPEQSASVNTHPLIRRLTLQLRTLRKGSKEYKTVHHTRKKEKQRLRRELKQQIRDNWTAEQAVDDIERQLDGIGFAESVPDTSCRPQRPAQKRLMEALKAPAPTDLAGQYQRRDEAIDAIALYCTVEEGRVVPLKASGSTKQSSGSSDPDPLPKSLLHTAMMSLFVKDEKERPRRCFVCVGMATSLSSGDPRIEELIHEFYTSGDLSKHFKRKHLSKYKEGSSECKVCRMTLKHKMHFQNHALKIHGTVS
ncbi:C2H2 finger domain protein [Xylogone sp. PMI_703]|nr:C2H2 finger domain protein [Xylogone sp. PMI_703]